MTKPMTITGEFLTRTLRAEFYELPRDTRDFILAWADTTPDMTLDQFRALVQGEAALEGETPNVTFVNYLKALQERGDYR